MPNKNIQEQDPPLINDSELEAAVLLQTQRDFLTQVRYGGLFYPIGFAGILLAEPQLLNPWIIPAAFFMLLLFSAWFRHSLHLGRSDMSLSALFARAKAALVFNVFVWGLFNSWVISGASELNATLTLLMAATASMAAGVSASSMTYQPLQKYVLVLMLGPAALSFMVLIRDVPSMIAVGFVAVYFVYLIGMGKRQNRAYRTSQIAAIRLDLQTEALKEARNAALAASKAKGQFLAHMSHEIRTPLNGVIGNTELLAMTATDPQQLEYIATIQQSGQLLMDLLNDILDFSRISSKALKLYPEPVRLHELTGNLMTMLQPTAQKKGLQLNCLLQETLPPLVKVDRLRLQQLIVNLLSNALKFTNRGGITVNLYGEQSPGQCWQLHCEVADTGIGIAEQDQERIFDQFTQVETHADIRGSGLGLSICKQLVELMGGQIGVKSQLGVGSTFWFCLPSEPAPAVPGAEADNHAVLAQPSMPG
jgi:signal transduction histidine kinase